MEGRSYARSAEPDPVLRSSDGQQVAGQRHVSKMTRGVVGHVKQAVRAVPGFAGQVKELAEKGIAALAKPKAPASSAAANEE